MTYTYQWKRCNSSGLSCVDIAGETSPDYVVTSADLGSTLRVAASDGVQTVVSDPTPVITNPPAVPTAGIGTLRMGSSYPYGTHYTDMHSIVVGAGDVDAAVALTGPLALWYVSGIQVERDETQRYVTSGIKISDARANGWLYHKSGHELLYSGGTTSLADVGDVAYQNAWAASVIAFCSAHGLDGIHVDNFEMSLSNFAASLDGGGAFSYPTDESSGASQSAFEAAQVSFAANALAQVKAAGYYVLVNGAGMLYGAEEGGRGTDSGTLTNAWIDEYYSYVDAVEIEYWLQNPGNVAMMRSHAITDTYPYYDGWLGVMAHALSKGIAFHGLVYGGAADVARAWYGRGSFLLEWDGAGGCLAWGPVSNSDNWNSALATLVGTPTAAKTQPQTGVYKRPYTLGTIYVNTTTSTVTVDGHTLGPISALWV